MSADELASPNLPCAEKLAFDTKTEADSTANFVRYRYGSVVRAYHCRFCDLWHVSGNVADDD